MPVIFGSSMMVPSMRELWESIRLVASELSVLTWTNAGWRASSMIDAELNKEGRQQKVMLRCNCGTNVHVAKSLEGSDSHERFWCVRARDLERARRAD